MADVERTCDKCGKTFKSDGAVLSPATMLAALRAERTKIDVAIGAIEALA